MYYRCDCVDCCNAIVLWLHLLMSSSCHVPVMRRRMQKRHLSCNKSQIIVIMYYRCDCVDCCDAIVLWFRLLMSLVMFLSGLTAPARYAGRATGSAGPEVRNSKQYLTCRPRAAVVLFQPRYRSSHPENYAFSLPNKILSGKKYPTNIFISF